MRQLHPAQPGVARRAALLLAAAAIVQCAPAAAASREAGTEATARASTERAPGTPSGAQAGWVGAARFPHYFAVIVSDIDTSVAWYSAALGVRELDRSQAPGGALTIVNLTSDQFFVELIHDRRVTADGRHRGFFKVGFTVDDVDAVADRLEELTRERPRIVQAERHGIRILQLRDPDGNTLQLHQDGIVGSP